MKRLASFFIAIISLLQFSMANTIADTGSTFKGLVSFQGKPIANSEIYFLNPSGGSNQIATYSDSTGKFELELKGSGLAMISILVPSVGKPQVALGNFLVRLSNNQIKDVLYDSPPSTESVAFESGFYQLELKIPTITLRVLNNGMPVDTPILEPNGFGGWPWLKGNKDGYIGIYAKSCLTNCSNYGYFYLGYEDGPFNVVKVANGFAARLNYMNQAEVKDQFGKSISSVDGVFNLNLLTSSQMPNGSANLGVFPPAIGPDIKNVTIPNSKLSVSEILKIEFDVESSYAYNFGINTWIHVAMRDRAKTLGFEIPISRDGKDPFLTHWKGQLAIPTSAPLGQYDIAISVNGGSGGPLEKVIESAVTLKLSQSSPTAIPTLPQNHKDPKPSNSIQNSKKITLICYKGSKSLKIIASTPKCPSGYQTKH